MVRAIPLEGSLEAFLEKDGGFVAEELLGMTDIGEGIADVSVASRFVVCLKRFSGNAAEDFPNLIERDAMPGANVKDSAGGGGSFTGQEVGLNGVVDIGEIARLLTVTKDDWRSV